MGGKTAIAIGLVAGLVVGGAVVAGVLVLTPGPSASVVADPSVSPAPSAVDVPSASPSETAPIVPSSTPSTSPSAGASPSVATGAEAAGIAQPPPWRRIALSVDYRVDAGGVVRDDAAGRMRADAMERDLTANDFRVAVTL